LQGGDTKRYQNKKKKKKEKTKKKKKKKKKPPNTTNTKDKQNNNKKTKKSLSRISLSSFVRNPRLFSLSFLGRVDEPFFFEEFSPEGKFIIRYKM